MTGVRATRPRSPSTDEEAVPGGHQEFVRLWHELQVHEAELEMQTEALRRTREELERSKSRYFELYELAPVGYLTVDAGGRILQANLMFASLLAVGRSRIVGARFEHFLSAPDRARFERHVQEVLHSAPQKRSLEVALRRPDGSLFPAALESTSGGENDPSALRMAVLDLTNQRLAEEAVRDRELRLQALLDTVSDGIVTVHWSGKVDSCNVTAARLFKTSPNRLVGRLVNRLIPGFLKQVGKGRVELVAERGNGERFPVEVAVNELSGGTKTKLVGVITDITERKARDEALKEVLSRFEQIVDRIDDGVYIVSAKSRQSLYLSPAFEAIYGRGADELLREPWPRLAWVHEDDRAALAEAVDGIAETGSFDRQYQIVRPDGSLRTVRNRAFYIPQHDRVTGVIRDVTDELALQTELRQAQRLEAIGTLSSGIAHDFNNLLMGVGGCAQLALRRIDPEHEAYGYLKRAMDAILRGANLTRQILRFSDTRRPTEDAVELDAVVADARGLLASLVGEQIALHMVAGAPGLCVEADPGDVEQVLLNLASNARDAMPNGGTLTLSTEAVQGGKVALSVRDTGVGMNDATRGRVFEPFFTTKEVGKGTGLGLSTVFAVMRRMGGTVSVDSAPGRGTTFTLFFPVVLQTESTHGPSEVEATRGEGQTILIVDDDPLVRMTVATHVETLGYRALTASNVDEALDVYTENARLIDVVLTDVMMPGLLGSDLGRTLKTKTPGVAVIYMSAHPWHELVRKGHLPEHSRLLSKPFDARDLGAALQRALAERSQVSSDLSLRVFVVDDDVDVVEALRDVLELDGHEVAASTSALDALERIPPFSPDIVLCDLNIDASMNGFELVSKLRSEQRLRSTVYLAVTGMPAARCREPALAAGFSDVLTKPLDFDRLSRRLASAVIVRQSP